MKPMLCLHAVTDEDGHPLVNEDESGRRLCWRVGLSIPLQRVSTSDLGWLSSGAVFREQNWFFHVLRCRQQWLYCEITGSTTFVDIV